MFLVGCALSFTTYMVAENKDIRSGILNAVDLVYIVAILMAIIAWGERKVRFKPFEKWYLVGAGGIVAYGFITGNAWKSNVLAQILMSVAYIPTFHALISQKKNTESFAAWTPAAVNALVALYPADNNLAVGYALRAFVFSSATSALMVYYHFKGKKP